MSWLATLPPLQEADVQESCFAISTLSFVLPLKVRLNIRLYQATLTSIHSAPMAPSPLPVPVRLAVTVSTPTVRTLFSPPALTRQPTTGLILYLT